MSAFRLFNSFRVRLLLVLASLLVGTLGVQYYLNRRQERRVALTIAKQEQALAASVGLALQSITTEGKYLYELDGEHKLKLRDQHPSVMNILIVREDGRIDDSLDPDYMPERLSDGSDRYYNVREVPLPNRVVVAGQDTEEIRQLLPSLRPTGQPVAGEPRAFPIRVRTSKGVNYIIVVLGSQGDMPGGASAWQRARPLLPTLTVMLVATFAAGVLVWRFTRPIQELSTAARRVAAGDFGFRLASAERTDEMGALARVFNEMLAGLGRLRQVEGRLHQAERSAVVGRLASAIAHEIRNPLNYINLSLDHLRTSLAPSDPHKRAIVEQLTEQLKTEVQRINRRITEFLSYTRPAKLEMQKIDLRAMLEDAMRIVEAQAAEGHITTRIEQHGEITEIEGDAESLRSLFTNLIINGAQAIDGGRGGSLTLSLAADGDGRVRVKVTDTGRGIPPENISQVFEPYFSTKETGTGLGLAIAKKVVEDHRGTITVKSKPGEGTTFTVTLPTEQETSSPSGKR